jgi:hypothetical protein
MKMIAVSTLSVSLALGACASTGARDHAGPMKCSADAAAMLVGQVAPDDATILHRTGSTIVRRIAPGDPTTKDYRVERVTVTVAEGRVVSAFCG